MENPRRLSVSNDVEAAEAVQVVDEALQKKHKVPRCRAGEASVATPDSAMDRRSK